MGACGKGAAARSVPGSTGSVSSETGRGGTEIIGKGDPDGQGGCRERWQDHLALDLLTYFIIHTAQRNEIKTVIIKRIKIKIKIQNASSSSKKPVHVARFFSQKKKKKKEFSSRYLSLAYVVDFVRERARIPGFRFSYSVP